MKITFISPSFYPATVYGGPIFSSLNVVKELSKLGHDIIIATTDANRPGRLNLIKNKLIDFDDRIKIIYYRDTILDRLSIPLLLNVKKYINDADVVYTQYIFSSPTPISLYYANKLKKPLLLAPRGSLSKWILENGVKFKKQWLNFLIKPYAKKIWWHATSEQEKDEILSLFPKARIFVIPNGISFDESGTIKELTKEDFCIKFLKKNLNPSNIIISMGRLQKKKGFDILISAFKMISAQYPDIILVIAGQDDGEKQNLTVQIKSLNLDDKIFLIGEIKGRDKWEFLASGDTFVLPSHNENFGNVYAEALSVGTPIVASLKTPWKEVEEFNCGKWIKNTPEDTATAIRDILSSNPDLMGKNGKNFIQRFNWINIARQFEEEFNLILKKSLK